MRIKHIKHQNLGDLVDSFQSAGKYVVRRDEALSLIGCSKEALKKAVERLVVKHRLAVPRRGFYVIVPLEYRQAGAPPPSWFIDDLMRFHDCPYYVGLLSAAAIYGAAHQQPQEFQVMASKQLRPLAIGRSRVQFFTKNHLKNTPTGVSKTETGNMIISTPEATALDLVRYLEGAGHLNHVATTLSELASQMDPEKLVAAAREETEMAHIQRLGYLLDHVGTVATLTDPLAAWLVEKKVSLVPLRPDKEAKKSPKNNRWKIQVNETIEVDEI